jgi:hypothetical protein
MIHLVLVCIPCHNHINIHQEYLCTLVDDIDLIDIRSRLENKNIIFPLCARLT